MRTESLLLLKAFTEAFGVSGFEDDVRNLLLKKWQGKGKISCDKMGSIWCNLGGDGPRVMVSAHMDEVGFRVQSINTHGFIELVPIGGWWTHNLLAQRVVIQTYKKENIPGVIASPPPHHLSKAEKGKVMPLDNLYVDIGAESASQAHSWGINIGDPIVPTTRFAPLTHKDRFAGKALDNRVGVAAVAQLADLLGGRQRSCNLILAASVQEEVGLRGAPAMVRAIQPDIAIVLECAPADDTPGFNISTAQAQLGEGPQIRLHDPGAIMNPKLANFIIENAIREKIPHQTAVRRSGGTDAGQIHREGRGIPSIVLSVPARSIHSHQSIFDIRDYLTLLQLVELTINKLNSQRISSFTDFLG